MIDAQNGCEIASQPPPAPTTHAPHGQYPARTNTPNWVH